MSINVETGLHTPLGTETVPVLAANWFAQQLQAHAIDERLQARLERIVLDQYGALSTIPQSEAAAVETLLDTVVQLQNDAYQLDSEVLELPLRYALTRQLQPNDSVADALQRLNHIRDQLAPLVTEDQEAYTATELNYLAHLVQQDELGNQRITAQNFSGVVQLLGAFELSGNLIRQSSLQPSQGNRLLNQLADYWLDQQLSQTTLHHSIQQGVRQLADTEPVASSVTNLLARLTQTEQLIETLDSSAYRALDNELIIGFLHTAGTPLQANNSVADLLDRRTVPDNSEAFLSQEEHTFLQRFINDAVLNIPNIHTLINAQPTNDRVALNDLDIFNQLLTQAPLAPGLTAVQRTQLAADIRSAQVQSQTVNTLLVQYAVPATLLSNTKLITESDLARDILDFLLENSTLSYSVRQELKYLGVLELAHNPLQTLERVQALISTIEAQQSRPITFSPKQDGNDYHYAFNYDNFLINHLRSTSDLQEVILGNGNDIPSITRFYQDIQAAFEAVEQSRARVTEVVGDAVSGRGFRLSSDLDLLLAYAVQDGFFTNQDVDVDNLRNQLNTIFDPTDFRLSILNITIDGVDSRFEITHDQVIALLAQYSQGGAGTVTNWADLETQFANQVSTLVTDAEEHRFEILRNNSAEVLPSQYRTDGSGGTTDADRRNYVSDVLGGDATQNIRSLGQQITLDLIEYYGAGGVQSDFNTAFTNTLSNLGNDDRANKYYDISSRLVYRQEVAQARFSFVPQSDPYTIQADRGLDVYVERAWAASENRAAALGQTFTPAERAALETTLSEELDTWVTERGGNPTLFIDHYIARIGRVDTIANFATQARNEVALQPRFAGYAREGSERFNELVPAIYMFRGKYLQNLRNYQTIQLDIQRQYLEIINENLDLARDNIQTVRLNTSDTDERYRITNSARSLQEFLGAENISRPGLEHGWRDIEASVQEWDVVITRLDALSRTANDESNQIAQTLQQTIGQYNTNFEGLSDFTRQYFQSTSQFLNG